MATDLVECPQCPPGMARIDCSGHGMPKAMPRGPEQALIDMCRIGDNLQSEADRMAAWFREEQHRRAFPYEIHMALVSVERLVEEWTELRRSFHP